ncbi:MAG: hypothetical protein HY556_01675 [Euryarchaeota archaeon]|nr:hypothetical protein [Euryarchaeota archaeon]
MATSIRKERRPSGMLVVIALVFSALVPLVPAATATGAADLRVSWISISPLNPMQGEQVAFTATVANLGNASASDFSTRFILNGTIWGPDVFVGNLAAGSSMNVSAFWTWTAISGNHSIMASADVWGNVSETSEANNNFTRAFLVDTVGSHKPDFAAVGVSVSPLAPAGDDPVVFTAQIRNDGNASTSYLRYSWYLDGSNAGGGELYGTMSPGQSVYPSLWVQLGPGNHTATIFADPFGQTDEWNETNNNESGAVYVSPGAPDLRILAISSSDVAPAEGDTTAFTAWVENVGSLRAENLTVFFEIDGVYLSEARTGTVFAHGSENVTSANWTPPPGNHTVRVVADYYSEVRESDEANNELSETFLVSTQSRADLIIASMVLTPSSPTAGQSVYLSALVSNNGSASAGPSLVSFFVDGFLSLGERSVGPLLPGDAQWVTSSSWSAQPGGHGISATADSRANVTESNEDNNMGTYSFGVDPGLPDLVAKSASVYPWPPGAGSYVSFSANVTNLAYAGTGSFKVKWLRDGFLLAEQSASPMGAWETRAFYAGYFASVSGWHNVTFIVDSTSNVTESAEWNNVAKTDFYVEGVDVSPQSQRQGVLPGQTAYYWLQVWNNRTTSDWVHLSASLPPSGWAAALDHYDVYLTPGGSTFVRLGVTAPLVPVSGLEAAVSIQAQSDGRPELTDWAWTYTAIPI